MTLEMFAVLLKYLAGIAAFVSAFLWWYSSTIEITETNPVALSGVYLNGVDVLTTYRIQARWNKWAAIATGISIIFPWLSEIIVRGI